MTDGSTAAGRAMVRELLAAHDGLRQDLTSLQGALRLLQEQSLTSAVGAQTVVSGLTMRQNAWQLRSFCDFYCNKVNTHHSIEDFRIFPAVLRIDPGLAPVVEQLEEDHLLLGRLLNALIEAVAALPGTGDTWARARAAVGDLADHLQSHLDREEQHILPALGRLPGWI